MQVGCEVAYIRGGAIEVVQNEARPQSRNNVNRKDITESCYVTLCNILWLYYVDLFSLYIALHTALQYGKPNTVKFWKQKPMWIPMLVWTDLNPTHPNLVPKWMHCCIAANSSEYLWAGLLLSFHSSSCSKHHFGGFGLASCPAIFVESRSSPVSGSLDGGQSL